MLFVERYSSNLIVVNGLGLLGLIVNFAVLIFPYKVSCAELSGFALISHAYFIASILFIIY